MTKVALIVPTSSYPIDANIPITLGYIASYLEKVNPDVELKLFDGLAGDNVEQLIFEFQPDIVGVTATTPQITTAYRLADLLRENRPDILTVIGGVHASALPHEASEHFDVVVVGEGEKAFANIVNSFQKHLPLPSIIYGESEENLTNLPIIDYTLFNMKYYLEYDWSAMGLNKPCIMLLTSYGCPNKCVFCHNGTRTRKLRYFSAERIADEIMLLHNRYNVNDVYFQDDEFLINFQRLKELKTILEERGITKWLHWACNARSTTLSIDTLKLIKDMGCVMVLVGFESGNERILSYLKAGSVKITNHLKAVENCNEVGMNLGGFFIIGTPTETLQEMKDTQRFIEHANLKLAIIHVLTPYPATKLWDDCKQLGLIPNKTDYDRLNSGLTVTSYTITSLPHKQFKQFVLDLTVLANTLSSIHRDNLTLRSFLSKSIHGDFRYCWRKHPKIMINELGRILNANKL